MTYDLVGDRLETERIVVATRAEKLPVPIPG